MRIRKKKQPRLLQLFKTDFFLSRVSCTRVYRPLKSAKKMPDSYSLFTVKNKNIQISRASNLYDHTFKRRRRR